MKISISCTNYDGLVTSTCLFHVVHNATCAEINKKKIEKLNQGKVSFYDPRLEKLVKFNIRASRLSFTSDVSFIARENINEKKKQRIFEKGEQYYNENLKGKVFTVRGLIYKPKNDDVHEAEIIRKDKIKFYSFGHIAI
jgi:UDP-glucose 6-dehydrogenase